MTEGWRLVRRDGVELAICAALALPGFVHGFSTRHGRPEDLAAAAGAAGRRILVLRQVHGNRVVRASAAGQDEPADAAVWLAGDPVDPVPAVRTADCVPILLLDVEGRGAAAVHAGWRGTAAGIAREAIAALEGGGVPATRLVAAIGPAIGPCCYEVGPEVVEAVRRISGEGSVVRERHVDLAAANRRQLARAGVPESRIHACGWCTACLPERFFSHRGEDGTSGRMTALIGPAGGLS